jgi:hypothetical protein
MLSSQVSFQIFATVAMIVGVAVAIVSKLLS